MASARWREGELEMSGQWQVREAEICLLLWPSRVEGLPRNLAMGCPWLWATMKAGYEGRFHCLDWTSSKARDATGGYVSVSGLCRSLTQALIKPETHVDICRLYLCLMLWWCPQALLPLALRGCDIGNHPRPWRSSWPCSHWRPWVSQWSWYSQQPWRWL